MLWNSSIIHKKFKTMDLFFSVNQSQRNYPPTITTLSPRLQNKRQENSKKKI